MNKNVFSLIVFFITPFSTLMPTPAVVTCMC